ncbi:MAG TPA: J domain-containing protein [Chthoniobacterales bacterium]|nr:J domain-containing protein [Chthoniobacterales bacterium]
MTDYFALLEQPRTPWLDPVALKDAYHRRTLHTHPDSAPAGPANDFAELNAAYQTLQDPKRRLHHLLSLENQAPSANQTVPLGLQELFLDLGALKQRADSVVEKSRVASNALSRSLMTPEMVAIQNDLAMWRERIRALMDSATEELREMNPRWLSDRDAQIVALTNLYLKFAYLGRWSEQMDEIAFQLTA